MNIKDWLEIERDIVEAVVTFVFAMIAPGLLILMIFHQDWISELSVATLLLVAISIAGPNVFFWYMIVSVVKRNADLKTQASLAGQASLIAFTLPLFHAHKYNLTDHEFIGHLVITDLLLIILLAIGLPILQRLYPAKSLKHSEPTNSPAEALPPENSQSPQ